MNNSELIFGLISAHEYDEYSFDQLKSLTVPFDITQTSLRTNLSRMIKKDILCSRKEGKLALYSLGKRGRRISSNVAFGFEKPDWSKWDGKWWGMLFSVPNMENALRHAIRKKLLAYRFASLYPGFWIRPVHPKENIEIHLESIIKNANCTLIRFDFFGQATKEDIARLWNLDKINQDFKTTLITVRQHLDRAGEYTPEDGLRYRMLVGNEIVNALFADPMLPEVFLPGDWKVDELRCLFKDFDEAMIEIARPYMNKILNK